MAWETRKNASYYYTARKVDGRVVKSYIGRGAAAELAAWLDAETRRARATAVADMEAERDRLEPAETAARELDEVCDLLFEATMTAAGFWRRNYSPWRRRRDGESKHGSGGTARPRRHSDAPRAGSAG